MYEFLQYRVRDVMTAEPVTVGPRLAALVVTGVRLTAEEKQDPGAAGSNALRRPAAGRAA
jgi:hypothetical protein